MLDLGQLVRSSGSLRECIKNAASGDTIWIENGIH